MRYRRCPVIQTYRVTILNVFYSKAFSLIAEKFDMNRPLYRLRARTIGAALNRSSDV